jgi:hypothetical protein
VHGRQQVWLLSAEGTRQGHPAGSTLITPPARVARPTSAN